jgi:hypothetical protein
LDAAAPQQTSNRAEIRRRERLTDSQRQEGQAVLAIADAAMGARQAELPADFRLRWRNAFLKAQQGTFVPFTLFVDSPGALPDGVLLYVRAVRRQSVSSDVRLPASAARATRTPRPPPGRSSSTIKPSLGEVEYPVDAIFPVDLKPESPHAASVSRGFSIAPGDYDVYVVVRERQAGVPVRNTPRAAVLSQPLAVPDFWNGELTTSSVILADRLTVIKEPLTADELVERPYVIGQNEVTPASDSTFRRAEELVVVLLVYNPTVTPEKHFDLQVEYHFFQLVGETSTPEAVPSGSHPPARAGERYFNHTDPQRFNPAIMGAQFDPGAGQPVLAGQGIPLGSFDRGDYRLAIKVIDLLSGKFVTRDVTFTVGS